MANQDNMTKNDDKDFVAAPSPAEDVVPKPPRARVSDAPLPAEERCNVYTKL